MTATKVSHTKAAQDESVFYAPNRVAHVDITMGPDDWDSLRDQVPKGGPCNWEYTGPNYDWFKAAEVTVDGNVFKEVGIRKRSFCNSVSGMKPSLAIKFDKFNPSNKEVAEKIFGVEKLNLKNSIQDQSYIRQCLAYQLFRDAGIASPQCNFADVKVNGQQLGLYVNLEDMGKSFIAKHYPGKLGNLYDIKGERFEPWAYERLKGRLESFGGDESLSDIKGVVESLQNDSSDDLQELAKHVNLDQFITFWAMEIILLHWDGFTYDTNNAYLYFADDGRMNLVPWDTDQVFQPWDINERRFTIYARNNLPAKLNGNPKYRAALHAKIRELMNTVYRENEILAKIDETITVIDSSIFVYERNEFLWEVNKLKNGIKSRRAEIETAIANNEFGNSRGTNARP